MKAKSNVAIIMTFIVSHAGEVYPEDLGENTENPTLKSFFTT